MGPALTLLLLLELAGQTTADDDLDVVQRQEGDCISLECQYPLQHSRARKIWCRVSAEGECPPLASSVVNRGSPSRSRARLTDLGRGYSVVTMNALQPGDSGEYKCMVDTTPRSLTVRRVSLQVSPRGTIRDPELGTVPAHHAGPCVSLPAPTPPGQAGQSVPGGIPASAWAWSAVAVGGLLAGAAVLFAVTSGTSGAKLKACTCLSACEAATMDSPSEGSLPREPPLAPGELSEGMYTQLGRQSLSEDSSYASIVLPTQSEPSGTSAPTVHGTRPVEYATVAFRGPSPGLVKAVDAVPPETSLPQSP
ncbi:trem-like transcript 1 protein [Tachyglossus aculeatus]|uniref:trem-like transcript 1 protein n=1 Tax=Tachyglossus aculeatus TaxID=9261 RepID=UPI0018F77308|nr:trem-like transcript 1 protein [Tachyglossus aculeatus]